MKYKPEQNLQRLIDEDFPGLLPDDIKNNTEKYQDWLIMDSDDWRAKYVKKVKK